MDNWDKYWYYYRTGDFTMDCLTTINEDDTNLTMASATILETVNGSLQFLTSGITHA